MAGYHVYILSSLPLLDFGRKAPLRYEGFLSACRGLVDEKELLVLEGLPAWDRVSSLDAEGNLLSSWRLFEISLRNELVKLRAARLQKDPAAYVRPEGFWDSGIIHTASNAIRQPILDAEKMMDEERWRRLDELCLGHYFDFDVLAAYALKLLILERWDRIASADKERILEEALAGTKSGS
ncbi:MAG: DUF2764 family protein [Candidatus Omnitrophota bacterium]